MQFTLGCFIFAFSTWCVLSRHFTDGVIAKAFLSLSAITAFLVVLDHYNMRATLSSGVLLVIGLLYAYYRKPAGRPLLWDRRHHERSAQSEVNHARPRKTRYTANS
jgi:hypothetical protein